VKLRTILVSACIAAIPSAAQAQLCFIHSTSPYTDKVGLMEASSETLDAIESSDADKLAKHILCILRHGDPVTVVSRTKDFAIVVAGKSWTCNVDPFAYGILLNTQLYHCKKEK